MKTLICVLLLAGCVSAQIVNNGSVSANPSSGVVPVNGGGTLIDSVIQPGASAPAGDYLCGNGTYFVDCVPGVSTSRTDATASVTLNCSTANDRNKVVALTNAGAIALTGFTPGAGCPDGSTIFVDVQGAAAVATLTPAAGNCNGAATCAMTQGLWRVRSDGSQTFANIEPRGAAGTTPGLVSMAASCAAGNHVSSIVAGVLTCSADTGGADTYSLPFRTTPSQAGVTTGQVFYVGVTSSTTGASGYGVIVPAAGTVSRWDCGGLVGSGPTGTGGNTTCELMKWNGSAFAALSPDVTCNMTGVAASTSYAPCADTTNHPTVAAGDILINKVTFQTFSGGSAPAVVIGASIYITK